MHLHLTRVVRWPKPAPQRPAKVIQLEARREARRALAVSPRPERPSAA
jgi:hypothetical protein